MSEYFQSALWVMLMIIAAMFTVAAKERNDLAKELYKLEIEEKQLIIKELKGGKK